MPNQDVALVAHHDADRAAVSTALDAYASTYDGCDPEGFAAAFTADGALHLPDGVTIQGHSALTAFAAAAAARRPSTHHFSTNRRIDIDGDLASSSSHVTAVSRVADDVRLLLIGRYDDTLVRTASGWRIAERHIYALTGADLPSPTP